jgi:hypothetical protein
MCRLGTVGLTILLAVPAGAAPPAQTVAPSQTSLVDRILVRIENDIITESEVRELQRYQELVEGKAKGQAAAVRELIDQWVVANAAKQSNFPQPSETEVTKEVNEIEKRFGSPEAFRERVRQVGLSEADLRRLVARQIYLTRYIEYRFRMGVQVDRGEIEKYYNEGLVPKLRAAGKAVPPLSDVRREIRELLVQRSLAQQTEQWLKEAEARMKIHLVPAEKQP